MECLIRHKHTLKILYKLKHIPPRYKRKREWVFLSDVQTKETPTRVFLGGKCFDLYKISRVCLGVIRHSMKVKIKYSLLLLTGKHFIKCLFSIVKFCVNLNIFHGDIKENVNGCFRKHLNMTSELRHR